MGRLFWKFFLTFWLTILLAGAGVGTVVWLRHQSAVNNENKAEPFPGTIDDRPPAPEYWMDHGGGQLPLPPRFPDGNKHFPHKPPPPPVTLIVSGILASLGFSFALAWYFAKPLRRLRYAISSLAQGDLAIRVADSMGNRRDELSDLGRDFDHMAEQIDRLVHAQQRLLHDVSHELRSPLARIQASIGLAQQQPEKVQNYLTRIERESQRMSDLVGELLVLSRLEAGVSNTDRYDFDIGCLLDEIIADVRFEAEQRQVVIYAENPLEIWVNGWSELLHRAFENVLRNAVQYCKKGGEVRVSTDFDYNSRRWRLNIIDQGPGVAENDLVAIFEPFYRSGKVKKPNSVGLGLAIANRAIAAHGGNIKASNQPEGGLHIAIEIPLCELRSTATKVLPIPY